MLPIIVVAILKLINYTLTNYYYYFKPVIFINLFFSLPDKVSLICNLFFSISVDFTLYHAHSWISLFFSRSLSLYLKKKILSKNRGIFSRHPNTRLQIFFRVPFAGTSIGSDRWRCCTSAIFHGSAPMTSSLTCVPVRQGRQHQLQCWHQSEPGFCWICKFLSLSLNFFFNCDFSVFCIRKVLGFLRTLIQNQLNSSSELKLFYIEELKWNVRTY